VVKPFDRTWREARSAVGAPELLQNAKESTTLVEAVADCTLVIGTGSLNSRKPDQPVVPLPELAPLVGRELGKGGRVAVVFGTESHGMTGDDLAFCHFLVEIPTDARQPSMNLGQAVAVCLYELATRVRTMGKVEPDAEGCGGFNPRTKPAKSLRALAPEEQIQPLSPESPELSAAPTSGHLNILAGLIEETMRAAGYSPNSMQAANRHDLRLFLRRIALSGHDVRRILGLFRRILWRLNHAAKSG
jgi:tRNA/rRNA methyltransferase